MKAIVVTDQAAGTAGVKLVERPEPQAAINDVVVQIHASGFTGDELTWPSTWTDRLGRDRTPSIPGHELAGVVTALGYGTTGLSMGQRVFGLADWYRDGTLAEYVAIEARNLAPLPGDVDFTVGASLPISGLTAWQGLFEHGRLRAGQSVIAHGAAGAVGSMVTQLARLAGAHVIGTGRAAAPPKAPHLERHRARRGRRSRVDGDAPRTIGGRLRHRHRTRRRSSEGARLRRERVRRPRQRGPGRRRRSRSRVRSHWRRHREAVRAPGSSRRNARVHRRTGRGAARRGLGG